MIDANTLVFAVIVLLCLFGVGATLLHRRDSEATTLDVSRLSPPIVLVTFEHDGRAWRVDAVYAYESGRLFAVVRRDNARSLKHPDWILISDAETLETVIKTYLAKDEAVRVWQGSHGRLLCALRYRDTDEQESLHA